MNTDESNASSPRRSRPVLDERVFFNPAFVAMLIARASLGYQTEKEGPMPLALGYLVAPMILHRETREAIPSVSARLAKWADKQHLIRSELRWRAPHYADITRQGLRFGLRTDICELRPAGLSPGESLAQLERPSTDESLDCWKTSERLGRWLPRSGPPATILALLGVRP